MCIHTEVSQKSKRKEMRSIEAVVKSIARILEEEELVYVIVGGIAVLSLIHI